MLNDMSAGLLTVGDTDHFHNGICRYLQHIFILFESAGAYSFAADFARLTLTALSHDHSEGAGEYEDDILSSLFAAELHCSRYTSAYTALTQLSNEQIQETSTRVWADAILGRRSLPRLETTEAIQLLQRLPIDLHPYIARVIDDHLAALAQEQGSVPGLSSRTWARDHGMDYLKILYALRVGRQDYRGASCLLMDRLHLIKKSSQARNDPRATVLRHTLLGLINTLSCVAPEEAYIVTPIRESMADTISVHRDAEGRDMETGWKPRKRTIITLEDLRQEYQHLLDRCSRIERGEFGFGAGTEDEDDESEAEGATNGEDVMDL